MPDYTPSDLPARLTEKIRRSTNGCWEWTASRRKDGYGQAWDPTVQRPNVAHRVVYQMLVGPIPAGLVLDHSCRNRACVNPVHLHPCTDRENVVEAPGSLAPSAVNAQKTMCVNGHAAFRVIASTGHRHCIECMRLRAWRRRHPDQQPPPEPQRGAESLL